MTTQTSTDASASNSTPFKDKEHALVKFGLDPDKIIQEDGRYWMTAEEIGTALGYSNPGRAIRKLIDRHVDELEPYKGGTTLDTVGGPQKKVVFNTDGMWLLAILAKTHKAKKFRRFIVNMLKALERQEFIHISEVDQYRSKEFIHISEIEQWGRDIRQMKQDLTDLKISSYVFNTLGMNKRQYNKLIRYRNMDLSEREIAKLLDINRGAVRKIERISKKYDGYDYPGKSRPILIRSDLDGLLANKKPALRNLKDR